MNPQVFPEPLFCPLDLVRVVAQTAESLPEAHILAEVGIVLWRSSYYLHGTAPEQSGWLYVVRIGRPGSSGRYEQVEESRLVAMGERMPLESETSDDFEISYDQEPMSGRAEITGVFRTPRSFWNTFRVRKGAVEQVVEEIHQPVPFGPRGLTRYEIEVPEGCELTSRVVEETLGRRFQNPSWRRIIGPRSSWLC